MTTITSITVREQLDPHEIGDASASDTDWQEKVCAACEAKIEETLRRSYPDAELDVEVSIGTRSLRVDYEGENVNDDELRELVKWASNEGYNAACG